MFFGDFKILLKWYGPHCSLSAFKTEDTCETQDGTWAWRVNGLEVRETAGGIEMVVIGPGGSKSLIQSLMQDPGEAGDEDWTPRSALSNGTVDSGIGVFLKTPQ